MRDYSSSSNLTDEEAANLNINTDPLFGVEVSGINLFQPDGPGWGGTFDDLFVPNNNKLVFYFNATAIKEFDVSFTITFKEPQQLISFLTSGSPGFNDNNKGKAYGFNDELDQHYLGEVMLAGSIVNVNSDKKYRSYKFVHKANTTWENDPAINKFLNFVFL